MAWGFQRTPAVFSRPSVAGYRVRPSSCPVGGNPEIGKISVKGLGSGVYEIVDDHDTNTYRAVYAVKLGRKIYVLHAFQKKSPRGIKTSQRHVNLIKRRLKQAQELAKKESLS